jgi:hypothetical protein
MRFSRAAIDGIRPASSRRGAGALGAGLICATVLLATLSLGASAPSASAICAPAGAFHLEGGDWVACGAAYVLSVSHGGTLTLKDHAGHAYTSFPLAATVRGRRLSHQRVTLTASGTSLSEEISLQGRRVEAVQLQAYPRGVEIGFSLRPYSDDAHWVDFFSDGRNGLDLSGESQGWTPQSGPDVTPASQYMAQPFVSTTERAINGTNAYAFAPPPLDLALDLTAGWMGIGLVRLPDADFMGIAAPGATPDARTLVRIPTGAVAVDYPLQILSRIRNRGHGGTSGGMIQFPSFVLTFGSGPYQQIGSYSAFLRGTGVAPQISTAQDPGWWHEPLVDTWGEEEFMRIGAFGHDPDPYDAGWVERFAADYQSTYHLTHFTLIIDAAWQVDSIPDHPVGGPQPSTRFGGYAGMRRMIDQLHHMGIKVMLWWQSFLSAPDSLAKRMGVLHNGRIDPTSPNFPAYVRTVTQRLLGSGPGDLDADGLKLDYDYDSPQAVGYPYVNPSLGVGTAASYRYFSTFTADAHRVKPGALITAGIAAPQYAGVFDMVRLNDAIEIRGASAEDEWEARARLVSESMPGMLIDSDGGNIDSKGALEHFLAATVYGTPDNYFLDHWIDGPAISSSEAAAIGALQGLAAIKSPGRAEMRSPGNWMMLGCGGQVDAEDLEAAPDARGLRVTVDGLPVVAADVWTDPGQSGCRRPAAGEQVRVASAADATVLIPLYGAGVRSVSVDGRNQPARWRGQMLELPLQLGQVGVISLSSAPDSRFDAPVTGT